MKNYIRILVSLALLIYGLIRVGVGSLLFGQEMGLLDFHAFHEPLKDIGEFLAKSTDRQIVPVSVAGYVGYIALMGVVLSAGAARALGNRSFGLALIGAFLVMYALLFVNFQTINPKIMHLAVCTLLFCALLWLRRARRSVA